MYKIEVRRQAKQALDRLPSRDYDAVSEAVDALAETPRPRGVEKIKSANLWRVRQGDYRIVYSIDDERNHYYSGYWAPPGNLPDALVWLLSLPAGDGVAQEEAESKIRELIKWRLNQSFHHNILMH